MEPARPSRMVITQPPGSFPGMSSFATAPTMRPITIADRMLISKITSGVEVRADAVFWQVKVAEQALRCWAELLRLTRHGAGRPQNWHVDIVGGNQMIRICSRCDFSPSSGLASAAWL